MLTFSGLVSTMMMAMKSVEAEVEEVAVVVKIVAVVIVETVVVVVAARKEHWSLTRTPSQLSEAHDPAHAEPEVKVKSLDYSRAFRCEVE